MDIPRDVANTMVDPKAYAEGDRLDAALSWLRREAPLARLQPDGYSPFWAVTRHADILTVERQNELFHNGDRSITVVDLATEREMQNSATPVRTLVQMDNQIGRAHV